MYLLWEVPEVFINCKMFSVYPFIGHPKRKNINDIEVKMGTDEMY